MESNEEAREHLRIAERAEAAPYVDYPATPWWYSPMIGAWAAALVASCTWLGDNWPLFSTAMVVLVALEVAFLRWMRTRHGALPTAGPSAPPEITRAYRQYAVGALVVLAVVVAASALVSLVLGTVLAFVLVTGGLVAYERQYSRSAAAVRARLS